LGFKLLERVPVPLLPNDLCVVCHQPLEAVDPRRLDRVGIAESNAEQVEQLVKLGDFRSRHAATTLARSFVAGRSIAPPSPSLRPASRQEIVESKATTSVRSRANLAAKVPSVAPP
jgi:hypothetical protein